MNPTPASSLRRSFLIALLACVALTALAILFVDRPVSTWSYTTFHGRKVFVWLTWIVEPVPWTAVAGLAICGVRAVLGWRSRAQDWTLIIAWLCLAAALAVFGKPFWWPGAAGLAISGICAAFDWRPGGQGGKLVVGCLCVAVAIAAKEQLKLAFGRTWPETWFYHNPSWITDGAFGFHPFHGGGDGWKSFPSGHTTLMTSVVVFLWREVRPLRVPAVALLVLVIVGLIGSDFHFVSDMIVGIFVGAASANGVLAFAGLKRPAS